ncbi:TPA: hypothetical protein R2K44_002411 [Raoultella ornithinolytica]|nr:hypothetical protein [Raoultella ornithinolytica]
MKQEKIKGYYRMEKSIIAELNKVAANKELFFKSIVEGAIGIVVSRRINERGDLITPSYRSLCENEAQLIVKKYQLHYLMNHPNEFPENVQKEKFQEIMDGIARLEVYIPQLENMVKPEFDEKSDELNEQQRKLRAKENAEIAAHEKFVKDFHDEQKIVLRVLAFGIAMIPVVFYADKIASYLHKFF